MSVGIENGQITEIQEVDSRVQEGAKLSTASGKFLIPGLWDMHVHIAAPEIFFPLLIANGITGVREMFTGIPMQTIRDWRARPDVPRIFGARIYRRPLMMNPPAWSVRRRESPSRPASPSARWPRPASIF